MNYLRLFLSFTCMLLISAHFLRSGDTVICAAWTIFALLVFTRKAWVHYLIILGLTLGIIIWVQTGISLIQFRIFLGEPWTRLLFILGGVVSVNIITVSLLLTPGATKAFYRTGTRG